MRNQSSVTSTLTVLILVSSACGTQTSGIPSATGTPPRNTTSPAVFTPTPVFTSTAETPTVVPTNTPAASPTPFGGSGRIVFVSCENETVNDDGLVFERTDPESCEIYMMNADGSDRTKLTDNDVWDGDPAPSADGTKIAYVSGLGNDAEIHVMNADGSGKTRLTENRDWDREPAWSPDGTRLVFASTRRQEISEIKVMNEDGSRQSVLATFNMSSGMSSEGNVLAPAWSPRGRQIAFVREGFDQTNCQGCSAIFVMNTDGSNLTRITFNSGIGYDPAWSADGSQILYAAGNGIAAVYPDGSSPTNITRTRRQHLHPSWSPDGKAIAFQSDEAQSAVSEFDIYVVATDGTGLKRLTHNQNVSSPVWLTFPVVGPTQPPVSASTQHPDCSSGWSRLKAGDQARVSRETDTPNRVRSGPGTGEEITSLLHPGTVIKVVEGPVCAGGLIFWRVENESIPGGAGWTAEGDGTTYWLEPYSP